MSQSQCCLVFATMDSLGEKKVPSVSAEALAPREDTAAPFASCLWLRPLRGAGVAGPPFSPLAHLLLLSGLHPSSPFFIGSFPTAHKHSDFSFHLLESNCSSSSVTCLPPLLNSPLSFSPKENSLEGSSGLPSLLPLAFFLILCSGVCCRCFPGTPALSSRFPEDLHLVLQDPRSLLKLLSFGRFPSLWLLLSLLVPPISLPTSQTLSVPYMLTRISMGIRPSATCLH